MATFEDDCEPEQRVPPSLVYFPIAALLIAGGLANTFWCIALAGGAGEGIGERVYEGTGSIIALAAGVALWTNRRIARWLVIACAIMGTVEQLTELHRVWQLEHGFLLLRKAFESAYPIVLYWVFSIWYWKWMSSSQNQ